MTINRGFFFDSVRSAPFSGRLTAKQVQGLSAIVDVWESSSEQRDDRWLAYMLGTAFHETATTMQPIQEYGGKAYFTKMYDVSGANPARARRMGNTAIGDGPRYCGRGYVQLTWKSNYAAMSPIVGADLVAHPDRAMDPTIACKVMFHGMIDGLFTGKRLENYFLGGTEDWVNARRIINGLDRAQLVAAYARNFYSAISYTT